MCSGRMPGSTSWIISDIVMSVPFSIPLATFTNHVPAVAGLKPAKHAAEKLEGTAATIISFSRTASRSLLVTVNLFRDMNAGEEQRVLAGRPDDVRILLEVRPEGDIVSVFSQDNRQGGAPAACAEDGNAHSNGRC